MSALFKQLSDDSSSVTVGTEALQQAIRRDQAENRAFWGHLQEDAQEFLTHLLDKMHEELLASHLEWRGDAVEVAQDDSDGWMEVGKAQKIGTLRQMGQAETPLSRLLFGQYRSTVKRRGVKPSHCLEPFHCLTVEMTASLEESLEKAFRAEPLEEIGASKQLCIERLPPILIIHLKRFVYHPIHGSQKLCTPIAFPERLPFRPHWTTAEGRPCYRLTSIVHHHGRGAAGGHYTASVRSSWADAHPWWRIDDGTIRQEPEQAILKDQSTPYLLIYQRTRDSK